MHVSLYAVLLEQIDLSAFLEQLLGRIDSRASRLSYTALLCLGLFWHLDKV